MELIIAGLMTLLVIQMVLHHISTQKLVDKVMAGSYQAYKLEERADKVNELNIELAKKDDPQQDPNYL